MPSVLLLDQMDRAMAERLSMVDAANPFFTAAYRDARARLGWNPCFVAVEERDEMRPLCPAFLKTGVSGGWLEIPSLPAIEREEFWPSLMARCRERDVVTLEIGTFASPPLTIPRLTDERRRRGRWEYVLDLTSEHLWDRLSSNHSRNIKRAQKNGLDLRRSATPGVCELHVELMVRSMDRRKERGESVPDVQAQRAEIEALVGAGAGDVFQALLGDGVVSSILVLLAPAGAYYHSAGTSPAGMSAGASHFLIARITEVLKQQGVRSFNLGGVSEAGSGLDQFKKGFGGHRVALEAVEVAVPRRAVRWLGAGVRLLRQAAGVGGVR